MRWAQSLWTDEKGFIVTIELILFSTIVVIGSIVGFTVIRDALNAEMSDIAAWIQSFEWDTDGGNGNNGNGNGNNGNNGNGNGNQAVSTCIDFSQPPQNEI